MKNIRKGVFETNSSSTHSICIAKNVELEFPKKLHLEFGEFGWEHQTLGSISEKASYLYTASHNYGNEGQTETIIGYLEEKGIDVTKEEPSEKQYAWESSGYVDHGGELVDFINDLCEDKEKLYRFLFSPFSFIITGNDNSDDSVDINVPYEFDEYYKGN